MLSYLPGQENEAIRSCAQTIIDAIAAGQYEQVTRYVDDMDTWTVSLLSEVLEGFKHANELDKIDQYGVECNFNPRYPNGQKYQQEQFYPATDGKSIAYEYALTTNGELNDLILSLTLVLTDSQMKVIFSSGIDL